MAARASIPAAAQAVADARAGDYLRRAPAIRRRPRRPRGSSRDAASHGVVLTPVVFWDRLRRRPRVRFCRRPEVSPTATHVAQVAADLLAVALGSGDVIARLQRRNRDLALVVEAGLEDTARLSTDEVLHAVVRAPLGAHPHARRRHLRGRGRHAARPRELRQRPVRRGVGRGRPAVCAATRAAGAPSRPGRSSSPARSTIPSSTEDGRYSLEKWGYQSQLSMPLVSRGHVLGVVELSDYQPRDFAEDLDLIRGLGQVAAHALENASLFEQVDRRNRILNELVELGSLASRTRDLDQLVRAVAERVARRGRRGQLRHLPDAGRRPALRRQLRPQRTRRIRAGQHVRPRALPRRRSRRCTTTRSWPSPARTTPS